MWVMSPLSIIADLLFSWSFLVILLVSWSLSSVSTWGHSAPYRYNGTLAVHIVPMATMVIKAWLEIAKYKYFS